MPTIEIGPDGESGEQTARIDISHQSGGDEPAAQEERHGDDVVSLGGSLVDSEVVRVLDDEGPRHDLRGHIEHLGKHALPVYLVMPQIGQGLSGTVGPLGLDVSLGDPGQGDDEEHGHHDDADDHIRITDHGKVVQPYVRLLRLGKSREKDIAGGIPLVGKKLGQHNERGHTHSHQRSHRIE